MSQENPKSIASVRGHSLHAMLVPFPFVCFVGTLVTDLAYWKTKDVLWEIFSDWLLTGGIAIAVLAVITGLIDFLGSRPVRAMRIALLHVVGNTIAMILAIVNAFVHSRDGYTAIVPTGLTLSLLVVLLLCITGWMGKTMIYRHRVGVTD